MHRRPGRFSTPVGRVSEALPGPKKEAEMTSPTVLEVPADPAGPDVPIDPPREDPGGPQIDNPVESPADDPGGSPPPDSLPGGVPNGPQYL
jgi:hypothetical protein